MPQVSVIIPAYNAMAFLPQTLDSVLAQTFADFEVWVVNDGSTDPTAEWVSNLTDRRVRLINQANQGCAIARNTGLLAAHGQYVAFLDADDLWEPTKLEKQVQLLDSRPAVGLVYTGISTIDETGRPTGKIELPTVEGAVWDTVVEANPIMCGSTPLIRRECFESAGRFDQSLRSAEDWDLWIRIAQTYEFGVIKAPLVYYRVHASSKSHNLQLHLQSRLNVIEKAFQNRPSDSDLQKDRVYGGVFLSVAYRALQKHDFETALALKKQALQHYPKLLYSKVFHRLGMILFLRRRLGDKRYEQFLRVLKYAMAPKPPILGA